MKDVKDLRIIATGLDHPEGVACGPDGLLYAGGEAGQVYRVDPAGDSDVEQIADTGGFVLGVALDQAGAIYVCDVARAEILRIDQSGSVEVYCDNASDGELMQPNWLAFESDGSLLFSDSGTESFDVQDGRVIRVPPGGGTGETLELGTLHFPNGLAISEDGSAYVVETFTPRLARIVDDRLERLLDLPGLAPDGVAVTAAGGLVISCYYPYRILHMAPGAERPEILLDDERGLSLPNPTNVAFFGEDNKSLAIAVHGGQALAALDLDFAGAPLPRP